MHNCQANRIEEPEQQASLTLDRTSRVIARTLHKIDSSLRYMVRYRLYHGWSKGYSWTANRKAAQLAISKADFAEISCKPNVVINPDVEFGDRLLNAVARREAKQLRIHLPGTLREEASNLREKMVDTALAADLLSHARSDPDEWALVLAEDDDLVPPLFVAEAWRQGADGKVILLRKRTSSGHLILDDIVINGDWK